MTRCIFSKTSNFVITPDRQVPAPKSIHKDNASHIAPRLHPAADLSRLPNMLFSETSAIPGSIHAVPLLRNKEIQKTSIPHSGTEDHSFFRGTTRIGHSALSLTETCISLRCIGRTRPRLLCLPAVQADAQGCSSLQDVCRTHSNCGSL